jgi:hypothetical protein
MNGPVTAPAAASPLRACLRSCIPLPLRRLWNAGLVYRQLWRSYERATGNRLSRRRVIGDFGRWMRSLDHGRSPIADRAPWIVYDARRALEGRLDRSARVCEFGAGGSTLFFLDRGCEVVSIEHDGAWLELVRGALPVGARWTCHLEPPRALGTTEAGVRTYRSGSPGYENDSFEAYVRSIDHSPDGHFAAVFVDGRARADALLAAMPKVAPGGCLVLDNAERERYAAVIDTLRRRGWRETRCAGPGPYVRYEFWETRIFERPEESE